MNSHNEDPGSTQLVMLQASIPKVYLYHSYKKVGGYYQHPKSKYDSYFFTSLQLKCGRRHDCSLIIRLLLEENSEFFLPGRRRGEKLEIIIQFQRAGGLNLERGPLDDDYYYDIGEDLSFITFTYPVYCKRGPSFSSKNRITGSNTQFW